VSLTRRMTKGTGSSAQNDPVAIAACLLCVPNRAQDTPVLFPPPPREEEESRRRFMRLNGHADLGDRRRCAAVVLCLPARPSLTCVRRGVSAAPGRGPAVPLELFVTRVGVWKDNCRFSLTRIAERLIVSSTRTARGPRFLERRTERELFRRFLRLGLNSLRASFD